MPKAPIPRAVANPYFLAGVRGLAVANGLSHHQSRELAPGVIALENVICFDQERWDASDEPALYGTYYAYAFRVGILTPPASVGAERLLGWTRRKLKARSPTWHNEPKPITL